MCRRARLHNEATRLRGLPRSTVPRAADGVTSLAGSSPAHRDLEPKAYPLSHGGWSSCEEPEDELVITWDAFQATFNFNTSF